MSNSEDQVSFGRVGGLWVFRLRKHKALGSLGSSVNLHARPENVDLG